MSFISKRHKHKYVSIKDIYMSIKGNIRTGKYGGIISYKDYYAIIKRFWEIMIRDLTERLDLIHLPMKMGYLYIKKLEHERAFHYMTDFEESNKQNKLIKKKIPILDDYYHKVMWGNRNYFYYCKALPLRHFQKALKKMN